MPEEKKKPESKAKPKPNFAEVRLRHVMSRKNPTGRALINMSQESMESVSQGPNPWQAFKGWYQDQFTRPTNRAIELYQGFKDEGVEPPQIPSYEALVGRPGVVDPLSYSTGTLKLLRGGSGALKQAAKFSPEFIGSERGTARGWGAYFTDTDEIAESYAKGAGRTSGKWQVGSATPRAYDIAEDYIIKKYNAGDTRQALELLDGQITKFDTLINRAFKSKETTGVFPVWYQPRMLYAREIARELKKSFLAGEPVKRVRDKGAVTKWKVHPGKTPDQYDYLRWDKQAPKETLDKLNKQFVKEGLGTVFMPSHLKLSGEQVYDQLRNVLAGFDNPKKAASQFLLRAGIDGIKYPAGEIAGGAARHGKGAFNYVVFNPEEVKMVRSLGVEDLAKRFGLIYNGPQEGVGGQIKVQLFTDPKTGGTFGVGPDPTYKDVAKGLKELRLRFKPEQPVTIKEFKKAKRSDDLKTLLNKVKTGQWGEQREAPVGWFNEMVDKHTNLMNSAKKSGDLEGYARAKANLDAIKTFWKPKGGK